MNRSRRDAGQPNVADRAFRLIGHLATAVLVAFPVSEVRAQGQLRSPNPSEAVQAATVAGCPGAPHRELDFLLGAWTVSGAAGGPPGSSRITSILGGCAILEHYRGGEGRSITVFEPSAGVWRQDYVDHTGLSIRLVGGLHEGELRMQDSVRVTPRGSALVNRFWWTPDLSAGGFRQRWWLSLDSGRTLNLNFDGAYRQRADPGQVGAADTTTCAAPAYRRLDSLLGDWSVVAAPDRVLGRARITKQSGGCLLEETFSGQDGYEHLALLYYDRYIDRWFRVQVDTRGVVVRQSGSVTDGVLSLSGLDGGTRNQRAVALRWTVRSSSSEQEWSYPVSTVPTAPPQRLQWRRP